MTTVITFNPRTPMDQPPAPVRVKESVSDVVIEVNETQGRDQPFVALTDAETGKEVSVDVRKVESIKEE